MQDKLCIYLAGSIEGRKKDDVIKERKYWRNLLSNEYVEIVDPLRGKVDTAKEYGEELFDIGSSKFSVGEIISRDLADLDSCDMMLYLDMNGHKSFGKVWEYAYAYYMCRIPVIIFTPNEQNNWMTHFATKVFKDAGYVKHWLNTFWLCGEKGE